ncbi:hypothetical protein AXF42_Ash002442 [Apostasia shenzhenica]|uniref:Reverse transcriptase domain-containing protein n=1 Tax=Apostasia shenzhenica TaxID=1088818 RepID=A0A2I0ANJ6_9ASPA|nr:hypothetical protein AXF42_Ash002442 [Apostasia shenzhenica]
MVSKLFFIRDFWHIVKHDVIKLCLSVLNGNQGVEDINHTHIILIPKVPGANRMSKFRPISLCNVLYQMIVSKLFFHSSSLIIKMLSSPGY